MSKVICIAPHPDDETLGCGGTLLKHKDNGDDIYWLIVTGINQDDGWKQSDIKKRDIEIDAVEEEYGFTNVFNLRLPTTKIDIIPLSDLIIQISNVYKKVEPDIIYMPFGHDVHTDHQIIVKVLQSTLKWFRYPHIKNVYMYETISETEFNFVENRVFKPNVFVDVSEYLNKKIEIMEIYKGEMKKFPFPRSEKSIRALAALRGSQSGSNAAEAFELVFEKRE